MAKDTPSMAKNKIKRSLGAIFDPHPSKSEENSLWEYFESCCAYCGVEINRQSRKGHLDHLIPTSEGGSNNIHNHALSCSTCNGDEKREKPWLQFLSEKTTNPSLLAQRKEKIEFWLSQAQRRNFSEEMMIEAQAIITEAIENFELSVDKMRDLRDKQK